MSVSRIWALSACPPCPSWWAAGSPALLCSSFCSSTLPSGGMHQFWGCICTHMWPPNVSKPQQGLMRNKCSSKVDYSLVACMTDGKIKLIASQWPQMLFTLWSLSVLLTTRVRHSPPTLFLPQVHPFREIHHLGEFLPLHLGLQSIDFGRTISNAEQGEPPGAFVLYIFD